MAQRLIKIYYEGHWYYLDFRLEEVRRVDTAESTPFTDLTDPTFKARIRGVRALRSQISYMKGLDD